MNREQIEKAIDLRKENKILAKYGISYLDDLLCGIASKDFVLIGAESGAGKTELAVEIMKECAKTTRVRMLALEADDGEPIQRLDYKNRVKLYYADNYRKHQTIDYRRFQNNLIDLEKYKEGSLTALEEDLKNVIVDYKGEEFTITTLTQLIGNIKDEVDVLIIDHVDYFDLDNGDNDNEHMSKLMQTLRKMNQIYGITIIAISHLKKSNFVKGKVIPTMEDFHGSSSKFKQVKVCILLAPDYDNRDYAGGRFGTYITVPKTRAGANNALVARMMFNSRYNAYEKEYELLRVIRGGELGEKVEEHNLPNWYQDHKELPKNVIEVKEFFK